MACTRPVIAQSYLCDTIPTIRFKGFIGEPNLELPCNKCLSCKLRKAKQWALRCWHESQMHEQSSFVTFTYDDKHLPPFGDLRHSDFQLFMKRLRHRYPGVSYFMCGEYGDLTNRPHYHALLFGYYPKDAKYHRTQNNNRYYKSEELDYFWKQGFTDTTNVSYKSAGYIARYTLKKQLPDEATQDRYTYLDHNQNLQLKQFEYIRMSLNPAIGLSWIKKYAEQTIRHDYVLDPDGNKCPVPKYYLDYLASEVCEETSENNKNKRIEKARTNPDNCPSRLAAKEICVEAKTKQLIRPYL